MRKVLKAPLLCVMLVSILCTSCQQSDDTTAIFTTHGWSFTGFCYTPNWNQGVCSVLNLQLNGQDDHRLNTVVFYDDGRAIITMPGCTLSAIWMADGEKRSFAFQDFNIVSGSKDNLSPFSKKFLQDLKEAAWYLGDTTYLQLFADDRHYYLLFAPIENPQ